MEVLYYIDEVFMKNKLNIMLILAFLISYLIPSFSQAQTAEQIRKARREYYAQELKKEKPILDYFSWQAKLSVGVGTLLMDSGQTYLNAKVFLSRYGEDNVGMRFLGLGVISYNPKTTFSFSPVAINMANWLVAIDMQSNDASSVGVSLNYSF